MNTTPEFPVTEGGTDGFLEAASLRLGTRYCILRAEEVRWTRQYSRRRRERRLLTAPDGPGGRGSRFPTFATFARKRKLRLEAGSSAYRPAQADD